MKYTLIAIALLAGGCSPEFKQGAADLGAAVADEALQDAEWVVCKAASVGSVQRRYGTSQARARAWKELCLVDTTVPVAVE